MGSLCLTSITGPDHKRDPHQPARRGRVLLPETSVGGRESPFIAGLGLIMQGVHRNNRTPRKSLLEMSPFSCRVFNRFWHHWRNVSA